MGSKRVRSSNIEFLRIVAMIMIVVYHISYHCVRFQLVDKGSIDRMANGLFCYPAFYKKLFLIEGLMPFGIIANAVFILISGYFMVEKGKSIKLGSISKKLLLQVGFATLMLTVTSTIYYKIVVPDVNTVISMRTITEFNSMSWFVGYYFLVITIAGIFLNGILENMDENNYRNMLLVMLGIISLGWAGGVLEGLAGGLRTLTCGVFLYALGGYMKRYNPLGRIRAWALVAIVIILYVLLYLSYYNFVENNIHSYLLNVAAQEELGNTVDDFIQPIFGFDNFGFIPIVVAVIMLELFSRIRIPNSRFINVMGAGTFMVYLIHDNDFWRCIWRERNWIKTLSENQLMYCFKLCKWSAFVFIVGVLVYLLYIELGKLCLRCKFIILKSENNVVESKDRKTGDNISITE